MRFIAIAVLATALNSAGQIESCKSIICDRQAVRAILDSNGLYDITLRDQISDTVEIIVKHGRIESLKLNRLGIQQLPPEIGKLTALTYLDLAFNQLTSLPSEIGQLTALTGLNLSSNLLTSLPPEIGQLTALTGMQLALNLLDGLPPEILNLSPVDQFDFSSNRLCLVPNSFEVWLNTYSPGWSSTQDCNRCMNPNYLEYGTNQLCVTLKVYGCMDPTANNYNPEANINNGSCEYGPADPAGCMDPYAINYNPSALSPCDDCCEYQWCCGDPGYHEYIPDCQNPLSSMCVTLIQGCTDTRYLEFGTNEPCYNLIVYGCTDPVYEEYNPGANVLDPSSCITLGLIHQAENPEFKYTLLNNSLTITFPSSPAAKSLFIYTTTGTLITKFKTRGNSVTWHTAGQNGVYYIRTVIDGKSTVITLVL